MNNKYKIGDIVEFKHNQYKDNEHIYIGKIILIENQDNKIGYYVVGMKNVFITELKIIKKL